MRHVNVMYRSFQATILLICGVVLAAGAQTKPAATRPAPTSKEELTKAALAALKAGDADAYLALIMAKAELQEHCSEGVAKLKAGKLDKLFKELDTKTRRRVAECKALFDWSKAKQVEVKGGDIRDRPAKGCKDTVKRVKDINVDFEVDGTKYKVKLDDPQIFGGVWRFTEEPQCRKKD